MISNWKGFSQWKEPSGYVMDAHTRAHARTHTHTLYTVTNKDMAHHTLCVNCLEVFIRC